MYTLDIDNAQIVDDVWHRAGTDFQTRINPVTNGNIDSTFESMLSYKPSWNVFTEVLMNEVLPDIYHVYSMENRLKKFKRPGIYTNGSWLREIGYGLIKAHNYSKHATDVFSLNEAEVYANYHYQNRQDQYELSVSTEDLKQAFREDGGLSRYLVGVMNSVYASDEVDEFIIMRELLKKYDASTDIFNVHVDNFRTSDDPEKTGKDIAQKMRMYDGLFKVRLTERFNANHVPSRTDDTILICTPEFDSYMSVYVDAYAYNLNSVNLLANERVVIDEMPIDGCEALLADRDLFVCADTVLDSESIRNPKARVTNYFMNHWGIYSMSRFSNCVKFSSKDDTAITLNTPTVTAVTIDAVTSNAGVADQAIKGTDTFVTWTVTGDNGPSQSVVFTVTGEKPVSTNTFIDNSGTLFVGTDEQNTKLSLVARSAIDHTKKSEAKAVTVVDTKPDA